MKEQREMQTHIDELNAHIKLQGAEIERLRRDAELIRADEREACAKLCEGLAMAVSNKNFIAVDQRQFCAKQIRAGGVK